MLGGLETRIKHETDQVKEQLGAAVDCLGDLGARVDKAEKRLDGLVEEVNMIVDRRLAASSLPAEHTSSGEPSSRWPSYAGVAASSPKSPKALGSRPRMSPEERKEENFWRSRKGLRLRPIGPGTQYRRS